MYSNELDRSPVTDVDMSTFKPLSHKVVIKRKMGEEKRGGIYIPENVRARRPEFEGTVIAVGSNPPADYAGLKKGDYAYFSYQVGGDDSAFVTWRGDSYAVIPFDAVSGVAV